MIKLNSIIYDGAGTAYTIKELIGSGGFGVVYSILRDKDKEPFALKTINTPIVQPDELDTIVNEAKIAMQIHHENVVNVIYFHDGKTYSSLPMYLIMGLAKDGSLEDELYDRQNSKEFYSNEQLIDAYRQLCAGMKAINEISIHRDLKPQNILKHEGILKIADFGISKFVDEKTRTNTFKGFGTPLYIAPEAWDMSTNTIQMDIYAMGIIFYQMATLVYPFRFSTNPSELARIHKFESWKPLKSINSGLSPVICELINRMMEKSTAQRIKTWDEVESYLAKGINPPSKMQLHITSVLDAVNQREEQIRITRLENEKKIQAEKDFCTLVEYQFTTQICSVLNEFIQELNESSITTKFTVKKSGNVFQINSGKIHITMRPLFEKDFWRIEKSRDYRDLRERKVLRFPVVQKRKVLAWGNIITYKNIGCNLLLLEKENDVYGEWYMLYNYHSGFAPPRKPRPEPFPFDYSEIEQELGYLGAIHIYRSDLVQLTAERLIEFVSKNIV